MNPWLLLLASAALFFLYAVSLPGDDGECSVDWRRPPGRSTSSLSRRWRRSHGGQRRDVDRIWAEFDNTTRRGPQ